VVCAAALGLHRYSVVPHTYRTHLPERIKSRASHDIVLLCTPCHQRANAAALALARALAQVRSPPASAPACAPRPRLGAPAPQGPLRSLKASGPGIPRKI